MKNGICNGCAVLVDRTTTGEVMLEVEFYAGARLNDIENLEGLGHDFRSNMVAGEDEDFARGRRGLGFEDWSSHDERRYS